MGYIPGQDIERSHSMLVKSKSSILCMADASLPWEPLRLSLISSKRAYSEWDLASSAVGRAPCASHATAGNDRMCCVETHRPSSVKNASCYHHGLSMPAGLKFVHA